ncbi:MAG: peptide-methionine (S)-S-oxide reductase, partial [Brevundimonas sp.]|uniref:peptide-methionine (S)-S-oxide reductase n=1 Tax=Brevundimonas sp. TaxID=1871086 RepID=UPI00273455BA
MKTPLFAAIAASTLALGSAAPAQSNLKTAVFAGGCFWSVEKFFEAAPGVVSAVSGYSGGASKNPTYEAHQGHMEAVKVTYDPAKTSYPKLVDHFFHNIDPTDPNGQICDKGPSYRTA